jgi:predicted 3-demethylubiquinone-9 3-methyltransferase (glyoxalase superfamily)
MEDMMPKITPFLWFDKNLNDIVAYYKAIFPKAEVSPVTGNFDTGLQQATFRLFDQEFMAMYASGRPAPFTEATSFMVRCKAQAEVDHYWDSLTADGGEESMCGWLKDKYGISWQITPDQLLEGMSDPDPAAAQRVAQAMFKMRKIDIAAIEKARAGK